MSCLHTKMGKAMKIPPLASPDTWLCFILPGIQVVGASRKMHKGIKPTSWEHATASPCSQQQRSPSVQQTQLCFCWSSLTCSGVQGFASATCWKGCASITGRYSDTGWLKAVETMGKKKEKNLLRETSVLFTISYKWYLFNYWDAGAGRSCELTL